MQNNVVYDGRAWIIEYTRSVTAFTLELIADYFRIPSSGTKIAASFEKNLSSPIRGGFRLSFSNRQPAKNINQQRKHVPPPHSDIIF